jgi:hypothetical protein
MAQVFRIGVQSAKWGDSDVRNSENRYPAMQFPKSLLSAVYKKSRLVMEAGFFVAVKVTSLANSKRMGWLTGLEPATP